MTVKTTAGVAFAAALLGVPRGHTRCRGADLLWSTDLPRLPWKSQLGDGLLEVR
jgi:hypothetical protein